MTKFAGRRAKKSKDYAPMSVQSEDEMDTICLLSVNKPPMFRQRRRRTFRWLFVSLCEALGRRRSHRRNNSNKKGSHSFSTATSPTSSVPARGQETPDLTEPSMSRAPVQEASAPMYFIISEVGSEAMREELEGRVVRNLEDQWNDEEEDDDETKNRRPCTHLGRLSLSHCFAGPPTDDIYDNEGKEVETIPMSIEGDEMSMPFDEEDSLSSFSEDLPPPIDGSSSASTISDVPFAVGSPLRFPSEDIPNGEFSTQRARAVSVDDGVLFRSLSGRDESEGGNDHWIDSQSGGDRRDDSSSSRHLSTTRERVQLLFPPPIMPFERIHKIEPINDPSPLLGVTFPHPGAVESQSNQEGYPTLGIQSAHPNWIEREKTNAWEQVDPEIFMMGDDDHVSGPSLIQVETWTNNMWLVEPSNSMEESPEEESSLLQEEDPFRSASRQQKETSPMEWTRKLYQPIFRFAQGIATCGQLEDTSFDEAPFDEIENDIVERRPFDEVTNNVSMRRQKRCHRLKPNPKDSLPMAWFREVAKGNPLLDDFKL